MYVCVCVCVCVPAYRTPPGPASQRAPVPSAHPESPRGSLRPRRSSSSPLDEEAGFYKVKSHNVLNERSTAGAVVSPTSSLAF